MKPVSQTAFYCGGIRYWDALSKHPVCGDIYAKHFIDEQAKQFLSQFKHEVFSNYLCACRHRVIDDLVEQRLAKNPNLRCILIGAGFDTRAYRAHGGRWFEFDEPAIIDYKEQRLPSSQAKNPLQRIAIDFATETLHSKLANIASPEDTLVIIEGVTMYLSKDALDTLASTIQQDFPNSEVIADFMTEDFSKRYGGKMRQKLAQMGAIFQFNDQHPYDSFKKVGFLVENKISLAKRTAQFNVVRASQTQRPFKILFAKAIATVMPYLPTLLHEGYAIWVLKSSVTQP